MASKAAKDAQRQSRIQSRAGSVAPSPPAGPDDPAGILSSTAKPSQEAASNTFDDLRLLSESLALSARYSSEYMDENPLHGEPGSFVFASTAEHLRAQQQAQQAKAKAPPAVGTTPGVSARGSVAGTPMPAIKTEGFSPDRRGSKGGQKSPLSAGLPKLKRKKTGRADGTSPTAASPT